MAPAKKPKQTPDLPFAGKNDLGSGAEYEDVVLPMMQRKVRVRYLSTPEITRMGFLPDLLGYMTLVEKFGNVKTVGEVDLAELAFEEKNYQASLAHLAVMDPDLGEADVDCEGCDVKHPPSLWSFKQARNLHGTDLEQIGKVACRAQLMGFLRPFSKAATPLATPQPADTGESIPVPS